MTSGETIMLKLSGVTDGMAINDVVVPLSVLSGDTAGNGTVNATDVAQTKAVVGQAATASNFRADVNASGSINATDVAVVKSRVGASLPSSAKP